MKPESRSIRLRRQVDLLPGNLASARFFDLAVELFAITTVGRAAATAVAEKILFGRHFKLLKVEY
jgi:hypothetical protein